MRPPGTWSTRRGTTWPPDTGSSRPHTNVIGRSCVSSACRHRSAWVRRSADVVEKIVEQRHPVALVHRSEDLVYHRVGERTPLAPRDPDAGRERRLVDGGGQLGAVLGVDQHGLTGRRPVEVGVHPAVHPDDAREPDRASQRALGPPGQQLLGDRHAVVVDDEQRRRRAGGRPQLLDRIGGGVDGVGVAVHRPRGACRTPRSPAGRAPGSAPGRRAARPPRRCRATPTGSRGRTSSWARRAARRRRPGRTSPPAGRRRRCAAPSPATRPTSPCGQPGTVGRSRPRRRVNPYPTPARRPLPRRRGRRLARQARPRCRRRRRRRRRRRAGGGCRGPAATRRCGRRSAPASPDGS